VKIFALVLVGWVLSYPTAAAAQTGPNAVYNSGGTCCASSTAFIDASVFHSQKPDFCGVLNYILNPQDHVFSGGVIDARGLNPTNTSMTCSASPWAGISSPPAATILLPATGGGTTPTPIVIPSGWVLPPGTHLIGVADGDVATSSGASYSGTTIQACKSGQKGCSAAFSGTMISFCSANCSGVSVENLNLDGKGQTGVNGITNTNAGISTIAATSYVKNVTLFQIVGTGLTVSGNAQGSGPYSNITFDTNDSVSSSTVCLNVTASATQGFHRITCTSLYTAPAAVLLDASNTSLTDVRITGFQDGILVGSRSTAHSDVLRNVWGDTGFAIGPATAFVRTSHVDG
jgi:hypothetical protein